MDRVREIALDALARHANQIILCKTMIVHTRDEDDASALRGEAEIEAGLAEQYARNNYHVVINKNGESHD